MKESFEGAEPASQMTDNRDVLLTRRGNTLYVHLYKAPAMSRALLKPLSALPRKATLLNTGEPVEARVDVLPTEAMGEGGRLRAGKQEYLRIRGLPANELAGTVMVVKLEFEELE